jgi:hypothetical protein
VSPARLLDFSGGIIFPANITAFGSTQPIKEMSTRNLPEVKGASARLAISSPSVRILSRISNLT